MEEVYELADRVSVLRDSGYVGTLDRAELIAARLVSMMVGRDLSSFYKKDHRPPDSNRAVVLSVRGMATATSCRTAPSTCTRARCWRWRAWSAPAAPSSPG